MTSPQPGGGGPVVGREPTPEALRAFVEQAHDRGGALVLVGAAGVGKTAALEAAARAAVDATVLRAQGVALEKDLALSGLHQALLPLGAEATALPPGPRAALSIVLGSASGPVPEGRTLREAVFVLLHRASRARPVLLVIDDLHEMDRTSADVLLDVGRRLHGTRIGLLAGVCRDADDLPDLSRLRHHHLGPPDDVLEPPDPAAVARQPAHARRRLAVTAARIEGLPAATRQFLLVAALAGSADLDLLLGTVEPADHLGVLGTAAATRLVEIDHLARTVHFPRPADRVAVADLATGRERAGAHRALAETAADRPDARARHLAEAADGPDEEIAAMLERAAARRRRRGDAAGAVTTLRRAADLTPPGPARSRRRARAAALGVEVTGLHAVSPAPGGPTVTDPSGTSLSAAVAGALLELHGIGDLDTAHRLLVAAVAQEPGEGPVDDALVDALHTWLTVCTVAGRDELWAAFDTELARLSTRLRHTVDLDLWHLAAASGGPASTLERVTAAIGGLRDEADPQRIARVGAAAWHLGRLETCRDALRPVARRCGGASGITAQVMLAFDAFHTGRWTEAEDIAREALTSCDAQGYRLLAAQSRHCLARVAAARGDDAAVSALTDDMIGWALPRGARTLVADAAGARALAALGRGEFEEAYHEAADVRPPGDLGRGRALWSAMDLVEAAVRTHRPREAEAHVAALREVGASALSPRLALHAAAATAMAAADGVAGGLYEAALRLPGIDRSPFDVARVRLAYGQHLRRARATTAARTQLSTAFDAFAGLGAQPWTTRTSVELRATGQDPDPGAARGRTGPASLTAQEREVASLAASGMTNRQIAERLGLSSRTVDAHLYRAFPKLGITGRAGLRDALDRATD